MSKKNGQTIFSVVVALLFLTLIIFVSASKSSLPILPLIFLLAPIVFIIAFINTDVALIILIFSMILSPELKIAEVPAQAVVVRIDDILLFVIFSSWLAKTAINKELGLLRRTPLNPLIIAYISVCILSTCIGIMTGCVQPLKSSFYFLKYIEYFMLYFMVTNNIRDKKQIKTFIVVFFITSAITCTYALATVAVVQRATAPFEGPGGEANTLGGYLVLLFAIAIGIFLYSPSRIWRFCCASLAFFMFLTLIQTISRGSYVAFIFMYLTLITLTRRKRLLLICILTLGSLLLPVMVPARIVSRLEGTFVAGRTYKVFGRHIDLDYSASDRIENWKQTLEKWKRRPFLGYGITGVGLVDGQYPRILGEVGIIGFWIFIYLVIVILRSSLHIFNSIEDDWGRGLVLGFLAGLIGLLIHSFPANTFIIVRIMEPFWFLAAIVMMLPGITRNET